MVQNKAHRKCSVTMATSNYVVEVGGSAHGRCLFFLLDKNELELVSAWLSLYSRCFLKLRLGELVESALKGSLALGGNNSHLLNEEGWIQRLPVPR